MLMTFILPMAVAALAIAVSFTVAPRLVWALKAGSPRIVAGMVLLALLVVCVWWSLRFPSAYDGKFYFADVLSFLPLTFY